MDVTPLVKEGTQIIQAYAGGEFRISGTAYKNAVFVFGDQTMLWDLKADDPKNLTKDDFKPLFPHADSVDVVLLGTGNSLQHIDPALRKALKEEGLSIDIMDTGAACRTYNVLVAEGRRVVAALIPV